jgi:hypothetical protein
LLGVCRVEAGDEWLDETFERFAAEAAAGK